MPTTSKTSSAKTTSSAKRTTAKPKAAAKAAPKAAAKTTAPPAPEPRKAAAERALLVPVGVAVAARDSLTGVARGLHDRYGSRDAVREQLHRFESRGADVRGRAGDEARRARTDVEGRLRAVRSDVEGRTRAVRADVTTHADRAVARVRDVAKPVTDRFAA